MLFIKKKKKTKNILILNLKSHSHSNQSHKSFSNSFPKIFFCSSNPKSLLPYIVIFFQLLCFHWCWSSTSITYCYLLSLIQTTHDIVIQHCLSFLSSIVQHSSYISRFPIYSSVYSLLALQHDLIPSQDRAQHIENIYNSFIHFYI